MVQILFRDLVVQPSMLQGGYPRVPVNVCPDCGSVIFDPLLHERWHKEAGR